MNTIRKFAFEEAEIKEFVFPNNNNNLTFGFDLFKSCRRLESMVFSDNIDFVLPFKKVPIEKVTIPSKVDDLHFIISRYLTEIHISPKNKLYADIDGKMIIIKSNINNEYMTFYINH